MIQALTPVVPVSNPFHNAVVLSPCSSPVPLRLAAPANQRRFPICDPLCRIPKGLKSGPPLVVDSSSLIDGRIADVVETQIIDSQLVVPDFVLAEVQDIADSGDKNRRVRRRRGLEVLAKMQQSRTSISASRKTQRTDYKMMTVDQKVVALAKQLRGWCHHQ